MNTTEVGAIVRSVIVHLGLPFTLLSVIEAPGGWNVQVRGSSGGVFRFSVIATRPVAMRIAIQEQLEAQL